MTVGADHRHCAHHVRAPVQGRFGVEVTPMSLWLGTVIPMSLWLGTVIPMSLWLGTVIPMSLRLGTA